MIKNVVIFGLGSQGQQFIRYFLKNTYNVIGVCKTQETKQKIKNKYNIEVFTNYRECLNKGTDLLILCAYPINIYEEIIEYSQDYSYKILSDLPITFNSKLLEKYIKNDNIYLFLLETKLLFFENYFLKNISQIINIKCLLLQNKNNLKAQEFKKESIIVDSQYMLNNLLGVNLKLLNIQYKFIDRKIKNIEYIVEIFLDKGGKILYKYEDGKGITLFMNNEGKLIKKSRENIIFDMILDAYLNDINSGINSFKKEYFKNFIYLLTQCDYEKK